MIPEEEIHIEMTQKTENTQNIEIAKKKKKK
jgi:hypothetical protein